tara:strand:- start:515 stop:892 length:378 start_codon:yes stop_codon:yes gene_type:complete
MNKQISLDDARIAQEHLAKQFNELGRSLVLSNQETWELFLEQEESKLIPEMFLPVVKSILLGKPSIPIELYRDMVTDALKKFKYCPVIRVLHKMTDEQLMPELVQHSLKITAKALDEEVETNSNN